MANFISILLSVFVFVVFLNLSAVADHNMPPEMEQCKVSEQATDEDLKNLRNPNQPKTRVMKCFITCVGEKFGKIVNNKLNPDAVLNWAKTLPNTSEQLQQSANEIVAECKDIQDADRCESGAKIMDCLRNGAQKRGIKPDFHGQRKP